MPTTRRKSRVVRPTRRGGRLVLARTVMQAHSEVLAARQTPPGEDLRVLLLCDVDSRAAQLEALLGDFRISRGSWPLSSGAADGWPQGSFDVLLAVLPDASALEGLLRLCRHRQAPVVPWMLLAEGIDARREQEILQAGCALVLDDARDIVLPQCLRLVCDASRAQAELARAQRELRHSAQRFEAVFAHGPTAVLMVDAHGYRVREANAMALRMFDVEAERMGSASLQAWIDPADVGLFEATVQRALRRQEPRVRVELRLHRSDASRFWGDVSVACVDAGSGASASLVVTLLNINLRKQAQAAAADHQAELERRVQEKTADLRAQRRRLEALYAVSSMVAGAPSVAQLAADCVGVLRRLARADAVVLRSCVASGEIGEVLALDGAVFDDTALPRYLDLADGDSGLRVLELAAPDASGLQRLVRVPAAAQRRVLGVVDLAYADARQVPPREDLLMLEAAAAHLAAGLEAARTAALEREAAVSRERALLARELHDSIAQALAFMSIQLELLRTALRAGDASRVAVALEELGAGLRESTDDVRELLLHFRTRSEAEDIAPAIRSTVQKFELQCSVPVTLELDTCGRALEPDVQVQVLHILQEALSNVRKHARATALRVSVRGAPRWRIEVCDNGVGFDARAQRRRGAAQVGLQIMRERAAQIGASVDVRSAPAEGTTVMVEWEQPRAGSPSTGNGHAGRS